MSMKMFLAVFGGSGGELKKEIQDQSGNPPSLGSVRGEKVRNKKETKELRGHRADGECGGANFDLRLDICVGCNK